MACAPFPAQLYPAPHARHVAVVPAHAVVVLEDDAYPALQLQVPGCDAPPAQTLPAEQLVVTHVPEVVTQAPDVVAVEAHPGEHVHSCAWALPPVQLRPAPHARQVLVLPEHAVVVVDVDAYPGLHVQMAGCVALPPHENPGTHVVHDAVMSWHEVDVVELDV